MPYTFWTFALAWAAIIGIPWTSGFFSKDEILVKAFSSPIVTPGLSGGERAFAVARVGRPRALRPGPRGRA